MYPKDPEPVIIQSRKGGALKAAFIGCGGTGCNILAEGQLPSGAIRIAVSSEPNTMASLKTAKCMVASARELESNARISSKAVRLAGSEFETELAQSLKGTDVTFIISGLGGLSGGWGAVVGARAAAVSRSMSLSVACVPFSVEGSSRKDRAAAQLQALMRTADASMIIPNDMILAEAPNLPINRAFRVMNSVMASPINLFLGSVGKEDLGLLRKHLAGGTVMALDSAEWGRDNAESAIMERIEKSKWLGLTERPPKSAVLFAEGRMLYDDLMSLGKSFSKIAGDTCQVLVVAAGDRKDGLRVTAAVGY